MISVPDTLRTCTICKGSWMVSHMSRAQYCPDCRRKVNNERSRLRMAMLKSIAPKPPAAPAEPEPVEKPCSRCGVTKPLAEYRLEKSGRRGSVCKGCRYDSTAYAHPTGWTPSYYGPSWGRIGGGDD